MSPEEMFVDVLKFSALAEFMVQNMHLQSIFSREERRGKQKLNIFELFRKALVQFCAQEVPRGSDLARMCSRSLSLCSYRNLRNAKCNIKIFITTALYVLQNFSPKWFHIIIAISLKAQCDSASQMLTRDKSLSSHNAATTLSVLVYYHIYSLALCAECMFIHTY